MFAGLKVWLLRLDDWLERNRRYVRPSAFLFSIVVAGLAVELLLVFIVSTYALALSVGGPTLQLMTGVISAISAAASALAASYIYKANVETRKTTIKPRIFVYGSTREERQKIVSPVGLPLHVVQIEKGGIWVENDGIGPAILGTVYVIDKVKGGIPLVTPNASYTFRRLAVNERI